MEKSLKKAFKDIFKWTLVLCIILSMPISKSFAASSNIEDRKAIILILDKVSIEEIFNSNTPNMDILLENGAMGFMNIRAKSSLANRGSTYLSLGMGVRTLAPSEGALAFQTSDGKIVNTGIKDIEETALDVTPNNQVGLLGKIAKENGIVVGLIGSSDLDTLAREATMLAMDENGVIPFGYIDSDLLISDDDVLEGSRLNQERLLEEAESILPDIDILFIEYGDTVRIETTDEITTKEIREEQKIKVIEGADLFLGQVMEKVDLEKTLFMVITPNPSSETISRGNFGLTPIIMSGPNTQRGLLTSSTTRREGLVTNFDFGPTVLGFFGVSEPRSFIGESMTVVDNNNPEKVLLKNQDQNLYLRKYRSYFHKSFIILIGITLIGFYLPRLTGWNKLPNDILHYLSITVMIVPLMMMTVSLTGYKSIIFDLIYVFGGSLIISYILNKIFNEKLVIIAILALVTSGLLLIDIFFVKKLMIISPLGSDAIAGGRFYGIGNDYMGILLGSTILSFFVLFHLCNSTKYIMTISITSYMILVTIGLSPFFGANMGGTLASILSILMIVLVIFDKRLSLKKIAFIVVGAILGILLLAKLDSLFNPNPTHAGKALEALMIGGWSKFFEIIGSKLRQVLWNLINSSWNIILFSEVILCGLLYRYKNMLMELKERYSNLYKGFVTILLCSIAIFSFNDTGTIGTALALTYLFVPLGVVINDNSIL
ncbi:hypothetical protein KQI41_01845 [Tissierella pigra]|uniref:hypothetical protein n=1 Tax=Tissierella pigra TaxID=2607614 RepID=UPI001C10E81C|nr:hypothetical protein [Tissierella pigra]MBU5425140.1 hypothetical protein [Tissierella pigra]